mgnify:FL=1
MCILSFAFSLWQSFAGLPVCHGGIEYLVGDVLAHLRYEFFLYVYQLLCGVVGGGGRELLFKVLGMVLIVGISYVYRHFQLHLIGISAIGDALVELVKTNDFPFQYQIAVALHLLQSCLAGIYVGKFVLEDGLHGRPHVGAADGEVSYLYALDFCIVDACTVELVADGA